MKYRGKKIEGRNVVTLVIPRPDGPIGFIMEAVEDFDHFDNLCPAPEPPEILRPGGVREKNTTDPDFLKRVDAYAEARSHYMTITSLKATTDLEWDTVDYDDPATWKNWTTEMKESGFTDIEMGHVVRHVAKANCLDQDMLDEARTSFLLDLARQKESTSQTVEQPTT